MLEPCNMMLELQQRGLVLLFVLYAFVNGNQFEYHSGRNIAYNAKYAVKIAEKFELNATTGDAFLDCKKMVDPNFRSIPNRYLNFYTGLNGEKFVEGWTSDGEYYIHSVMRFHAVGPVLEDPELTFLCVAMQDATSYTYLNKPSAGGRPIAWVSTYALTQRAIGIVTLETRCWRNTKQIAECSPAYYPRPFIFNLPQFEISVLREKFWINFSTSKMNIPFTWIWKINVHLNTSTHNILPQWIYNMDVPELSDLTIQGNDWKAPDNILRYFPSLVYLNLSNNKLTVIPSGTFNNTPALRYLFLSHNNISKYPDGIDMLKALEHIDLSLSYSQSHLSITKRNIINMPPLLEYLNFENTLLNANIMDFWFLPQLKVLNLHGCLLTGFPFENVHKLGHGVALNNTELTLLDLSANNISTITTTTFKNLILLETLTLSRNQIKYIDEDSLQHNLQLTKINLSYNAIEYVPSCLFCELKNLKEVDLSNNELKQLPIFANVKLRYLGLSSNALSEFQQNDSFIDHVDLSYNNISVLDISLVRQLNLSYNSLHTISSDMWLNIYRLQVVDLGGNDLDCCSFSNNFSEIQNIAVLNKGILKPLRCSTKDFSMELLPNTENNASICINDESQSGNAAKKVIVSLIIVSVIIIFVMLIYLIYRIILWYLLRKKCKLDNLT